jgi:hypothetical protein
MENGGPRLTHTHTNTHTHQHQQPHQQRQHHTQAHSHTQPHNMTRRDQRLFFGVPLGVLRAGSKKTTDQLEPKAMFSILLLVCG